MMVSGSLLNSTAVSSFLVIPSEVRWSYFSFFLILAIGLVAMFMRGDWQRARGLDKLILFGPLFYVAPIAAFGTEHFTITKIIASLVPNWIPWHMFWAYLVGACFVVAALSVVTGIQARLAAGLLGLNFFLFVVLMDAPALARNPHNYIVAVLALRELAFSGGGLALAASLGGSAREQGKPVLATIARYFIAVPVLFYSLQQFLHGSHVPGVPLEPQTPTYVFGHAIWTYFAAIVYAVAGILLLVGKKTRPAATWLGLTVVFLVVVVYIPFAVVNRATLEGLNYIADTLMFGGAVLCLAGAMPFSSDSK